MYPATHTQGYHQVRLTTIYRSLRYAKNFLYFNVSFFDFDYSLYMLLLKFCYPQRALRISSTFNWKLVENEQCQPQSTPTETQKVSQNLQVIPIHITV